ncbi:hypothetical protein HPP92_011941 [Vanilla planifolia]|uniref:NAC domain-containing protein n=1 Tax=Vanilla planifolia TaxID=51239 RepID=A0A835R723_VANPL|nr:hypothetical protein HPP92_011941 [Vanilla planifolia]
MVMGMVEAQEREVEKEATPQTDLSTNRPLPRWFHIYLLLCAAKEKLAATPITIPGFDEFVRANPGDLPQMGVEHRCGSVSLRQVAWGGRTFSTPPHFFSRTVIAFRIDKVQPRRPRVVWVTAAMEMESCAVPPGFRFHPTEEELVGYYLTRKVASESFDLNVIKEVDLYRIEPWDLLERCRLGSEEQTEWYFFSHKDKKYPSGTRTNRATASGFWKATGRDKAVLSKSKVIGMRKTLVFYKGRAPNGRKSDWIMHEYRLQSSEHGPSQEEGWVVCRAFRKPCSNQRQSFEAFGNHHFIDQHQFRHEPLMDASQLITMEESSYTGLSLQPESFACGMEFESKNQQLFNQALEMPKLESPTLATALPSTDAFEAELMAKECGHGSKADAMGQLVDWKSLDKLLSTQMIHIECEAETQVDEQSFHSSLH